MGIPISKKSIHSEKSYYLSKMSKILTFVSKFLQKSQNSNLVEPWKAELSIEFEIHVGNAYHLCLSPP